MVTPRILSNQLLETDEDFDVKSLVDRYTASGIPGIELEREGNHWNVYKPTVNGSGWHLGEIYTHDMADAPADADPAWHKVRWIANPVWPVNQKAFETFEQALDYIVDARNARPKLPESLDPQDDPESVLKQHVQPLELIVRNANGKQFKVVLEFGGREHSQTDRPTPVVRFYDMDQDKEKFPDGQFISSYYASTLTGEHAARTPLDLDSGIPSWTVDAEATDQVIAWLRNEIENNRNYRLASDGFFDRYESLDPDSPELYTSPAHNKQPEAEIMASSLRVLLRPYYDEVTVQEAPLDWVPSGWVPQVHCWTVHCKRNSLLPLPNFGTTTGGQRPDFTGIRYTDGLAWRKQVEAWLNAWADKHGSYVDQKSFKITGRLRKDPTFTFETWPRVKVRELNARNKAMQESSEDDPQAFLSGMLQKIGWEGDLTAALWEFHPYGVGYKVFGAANTCLAVASTYFPPDKDGFAARFKDAVVKFLTDKRIMPVSEVHLYSMEKPNCKPDYPEWSVQVVINCSFPPSVPEHVPVVAGEPPVDLG